MLAQEITVNEVYDYLYFTYRVYFIFFSVLLCSVVIAPGYERPNIDEKLPEYGMFYLSLSIIS